MQNKTCRILLLLLMACVPFAFAQLQPYMKIITAKGVPNTVIVTPIESDEVLVNPGMGFTTQSSVDGAVSGYPTSTIAYYRWYWDELEPEEGRFNWPMVDSVLALVRQHGQRLATRIMPANGEPHVPHWYRETGAKGFEYVAESVQLAGKTTASPAPCATS